MRIPNPLEILGIQQPRVNSFMFLFVIILFILRASPRAAGPLVLRGKREIVLLLLLLMLLLLLLLMLLLLLLLLSLLLLLVLNILLS